MPQRSKTPRKASARKATARGTTARSTKPKPKPKRDNGREVASTLSVGGLSWLSAESLLAVVKGLDAPSDLELAVVTGEDEIATVAATLTDGASAEGGAHASVVVASLSEPPRGRDLELMLRTAGARESLGPAPASSLGKDLRALVREELSALDRGTRARILEFVVREAGRMASGLDTRRLSRSLMSLRDALREPAPRVLVAREQPQGLNLEAIIGLDERSFFVRGWMRDEQAEIVRLTAVSPEGERVSLLDRVFRVKRDDVDQLYEVRSGSNEKSGFLAYFTLGSPSRLERGWLLEMENAAGEAVEAEGPDVTHDRLAARATIVSELARERGPETALMDHVIPAVTTIQKQLADEVEVERVEQFGRPAEQPEVSIIVPLYRRIDLIQHQLACFAGDRDLAAADLIYVLDSPELSEQLYRLAGHLHEIYRVPFRLAAASQNGGFSVANNLGARLARGRLLLLLNSDVLPAQHGWLARLAGFFDAERNVGAVGPKLLFDDGTIQHAGVYWRRDAPFEAWENAHYFKGVHGSLPAANEPRPVPAITAACFLTSLDLYGEIGGLRSLYIQGDYEDTDLCLRLHEAGYETWYRPEVELYHLEGRSYDTAVRQTNDRYNSWLHTRLWGERIVEVMAGADQRGDVAAFRGFRYAATASD